MKTQRQSVVTLPVEPGRQLGVSLDLRGGHVVITAVAPGSHAARHLQAGDELVEVDGTAIDGDAGLAIEVRQEIFRRPASDLESGTQHHLS